jgi:bis(5'-nucleosyl)-tetraphosphatase (symmetrical)
MSTIAVGDVQGCFATLKRLLEVAGFDPAKDRLWLTGDLVNRGPSSLEVLRWVRSLGDRVVCVLGNHDLHLLALAEGLVERRESDTLGPILKAPDRDELLGWLSSRPLVHHEPPFLLVHAGLHPRWTVETAIALGGEIHAALQSSLRPSILRAQALKRDAHPDNPLGRAGVLASALRVMTKIRTCTDRGEMCPRFSGPPERAPFPCRAWFDIPSRQSRDARVVFGHWSALGFRIHPDYISLDNGCVWGRPLMAVRIEDMAVFQTPNCEEAGASPSGKG